ncbi:SGNH/GDSL hydrolase family protein [Adhaeribacter rhizoryzae]|uniref:SGNH/GDSL hydrolase family protein n=1 Tax=Adhaeribacter rhizoryzae TaxID=2607907 RepID=A0A5M6D131_9BACT|nr:SGNH/GDSL hydrolase family protein [Adhaeribacter rhizoryzae]KAA5541218.1 SGNH/GDSL hydrolase family protein [Adhaeribacter rhizoryzae]
MRNQRNLLALTLCFFCLSCSTFNINNPQEEYLPAAALQPFGRYLLNQEQKLELVSSAVHFGFSFEGTECQLFASIPNANGHNYLQYELDGVYQKRIRVAGNAKEPIRITAPTTGKHIVWVYKATEAYTGPILISSITGKKLKPLKNPVKPIIEFIGNSITSGAAADPSEVPCGSGVYHDQHNAYMAYGPRLARTLGLNFVLSSVSGIGVYRNWNSDGPTMPQVYEQVNFQEYNAQLWDFTRFKPQVVSIALGTNDFSGGDGKKTRLPFDSASYVNSYIKFVQQVKSKYPPAQIALLSSPMLNGKNRQTLQNCLTAVKSKIDAAYPTDKPVALYFFQPMRARGCSGHPNVEDHAILAQELVPFFKKLISAN